MRGQGSDGIVVISVPDGSACRCGEQMRAGERAGFDLLANEVICLRCMADRKAGRPQVLNRPHQPWPNPAVAQPPVTANPWAPALPVRPRVSRRLITLATAMVAITLVSVGLVLQAAFRTRSMAVVHDDPTAYAFMNTTSRGTPVTWDPCLTIDLVVNSAAAPAGSETLLAEAVDRVNAASGLHLRIVGPSTQVPRPAQSARDLMSGLPGSARAPVLVAWTTPDVVPGLDGSVVGLGGPVHQFASSLDRARYVGGSVDLDGPQMAGILKELNGHARARAVVMHELGHLVGLAHVTNPREVMVASSGIATEFGQGDLAGLRLLGSGGCPYDLTPDPPASSDTNALDAPS